MASNYAPRQEKGDLNPLTLPSTKIMELIYATHVCKETECDAESLLTLAVNILGHSTQIVDSVIEGIPSSISHIVDKGPKLGFSSPYCLLKQISSEMMCKEPRDDNAHNSTLSILKKLSTYSWDAKAVLTLAAFALDCGEFWHLAQTQKENSLANSLAALKRVNAVTSPSGLEKYLQAIAELNNVIRACVHVVGIIFELMKYNATYSTRDIPALKCIVRIPVDVYWAIMPLAASTTQIDLITCQKNNTHELSAFGQKMSVIPSELNKLLALCKTQKETSEYDKKLETIFIMPTEITEVFKVLVFGTDDKVEPLYDGSSKTTVNIEVLSRKQVLLVFTGLDITDEVFSILKSIYDELKAKHDDYKIIWIPISEDNWTEKDKKGFENLKPKMPWYVVKYFSTIAGDRFIKEKWNYKGKIIVVNLSSQGKVECENAWDMINLWGTKAFPFTSDVEDYLLINTSSFDIILGQIKPDIKLKEGTYYFFYGGNDNVWLQNFVKLATTVANDATSNEAKVTFELLSLGKGGNGEEDLKNTKRFWEVVETLFVVNVNKGVDPKTEEVFKFLSYKNEIGWAILTQGHTFVLCGHGSTIFKALEEFQKWKEMADKKGFEVAIKEYHDKVSQSTHQCVHLQVPIGVGELPKSLACSMCSRKMQSYMTYSCCHK